MASTCIPAKNAETKTRLLEIISAVTLVARVITSGNLELDDKEAFVKKHGVCLEELYMLRT